MEIKHLGDDLKKSKEELRAKDGLIQDLQKSVASFANAVTMPNNGNYSVNMEESSRIGKVDMGGGVLVNEIGLNDLRKNKKLNASKIVGDLTTLIFDHVELRSQTITGKPCNLNSRKKCQSSSGALDGTKFNALKAEYLRILEARNNLDESMEYGKCVEYFNRKVKYEKEVFRKLNKEQSNEETSSISSDPGQHDDRGIGSELGYSEEMLPDSGSELMQRHEPTSRQLELTWLPPKKEKS